MTVRSRAPTAQSAFGRLVESITQKLQRGEAVDWPALAHEHPEFADKLDAIRPALEALGQLSRADESAVSGLAPPAGLDERCTEPLGDFRLIREVGRGGMGIVYEAEQISLNRKVALKVLPFAATMDPRQLQRFRNEAQAAACLHHPNIVPVHGVGCDRGVHYYAMQLIEGQTLAEVIHPSRERERDVDGSCGAGVPPAIAAETAAPQKTTKRDRAHYRHIASLIASAADALEYAHSMGVVHRDIKPGNLMIDNSGALWITDFGLAKSAILAREGGECITLTGDLIGTLRYMSPEQALAKHGLVDHRTDIYSLGATLYELLTLKPAVPGNDKAEILKAIAWDEPTPLRKHDKSIPAGLETITLKCLAKEPGERYESAKLLADDLRRWLGDKPIQAKAPGWRERAAKWGRRHKALVRSAAAIVALGIIALSIGMVRERRIAQEASTERDRAQGNLRMALEALDESSGQLLNSMIARPMQRTPEELAAAKKILGYYDGFIETNQSDPALRLEVTRAYHKSSHIHGMLGDHARSAEDAQKALALAHALVQEQPDDFARIRLRVDCIHQTRLDAPQYHSGKGIALRRGNSFL